MAMLAHNTAMARVCGSISAARARVPGREAATLDGKY